MILVAEPLRLEPVFHQFFSGDQTRLMCHHVVRVGNAHGQEHRSRVCIGYRLPQARAHIGWRRAFIDGQVLMVGKFQPDRRGVDERHRPTVFFTSCRHHVVTCLEAAGLIPRSDVVRVGRGLATEDGNDRAACVGRQQMGRTERSVVKTRGSNHSPLEDAQVEDTPELTDLRVIGQSRPTTLRVFPSLNSHPLS